jgi:hypothetical protein
MGGDSELLFLRSSRKVSDAAVGKPDGEGNGTGAAVSP